MKNEPIYTYPLLNSLQEYFSAIMTPYDREQFADLHIVACQHILEPQYELFRCLIALGILPEHIHLLGKAYSTSNEVLVEMNRLGIDVHQPVYDPGISFDVQHDANCSQLLENLIGIDAHSLIVMDDGGALLRACHILGILPRGGVEQTSSGFRALESLSVSFPVINVARDSIKLEQESPHIAELANKRLKRLIGKYSIDSPQILIVGQGPIGREMQRQLLCNGHTVVGHDLLHGERNLVELVRESNSNVVVGATGTQIMTSSQLRDLGDEGRRILLASVSSSNREFEVRECNTLMREDVHADVVVGNCVVANNGFPITFYGNRFESQPEHIEKTLCLMMGSALHIALTDTNYKGLVAVPGYIADQLR